MSNIYETNWDAIIVGAGLGGLALGAIISQNGKSVLVLEKNSWFGGRASTLSVDKFQGETPIKKGLGSLILGGFSEPEIYRGAPDLRKWYINTGFHSWTNTKRGTGSIGRLFKYLNVQVRGKPSRKLIYQALDGKIYDIGSTLGILFFLGIPNPLDLILIFDDLQWKSDKEIASYTNVRFTEWLNKRTKLKRLRELLTIIACSITTVADPNLIDASEFLRVFREYWRQRQNPGHTVNGGILELAKALEAKIKRNGGYILLDTPVNKIVVEGDRVSGIETQDGFCSSNIVASNLCVQDTFQIVDRNFFPDEYIRHLSSITSTGGVGGYIGLDTRLVKMPNLYWTMNTLDNHAFMAWPVSEFAHSMAPKGTQLIAFGMMAGLDEVRDINYRARLKEAAYNKISELIKGVEAHMLWRIDAHALRINGAAQIIGQCGVEKPNIKPPGIQNLYLVGDTTSKAAGVGMEAAIDSAIICAQDILQKKSL